MDEQIISANGYPQYNKSGMIVPITLQTIKTAAVSHGNVDVFRGRSRFFRTMMLNSHWSKIKCSNSPAPPGGRAIPPKRGNHGPSTARQHILNNPVAISPNWDQIFGSSIAPSGSLLDLDGVDPSKRSGLGSAPSRSRHLWLENPCNPCKSMDRHCKRLSIPLAYLRVPFPTSLNILGEEIRFPRLALVMYLSQETPIRSGLFHQCLTRTTKSRKPSCKDYILSFSRCNFGNAKVKLHFLLRVFSALLSLWFGYTENQGLQGCWNTWIMNSR